MKKKSLKLSGDMLYRLAFHNFGVNPHNDFREEKGRFTNKGRTYRQTTNIRASRVRGLAK